MPRSLAATGGRGLAESAQRSLPSAAQLAASSTEHKRASEQRSRPCGDISCGCRPPIARIPAPIIRGIEPELVAAKPVVAFRPARQPSARTVGRTLPAMREFAPVDGDSGPRNYNIIAASGDDHLKEQLSAGWATSRGEISASPANLGSNTWCAHRDNRAAWKFALWRHGREPVYAQGHARCEVEA
jgi:hypothetical protein